MTSTDAGAGSGSDPGAGSDRGTGSDTGVARADRLTSRRLGRPTIGLLVLASLGVVCLLLAVTGHASPVLATVLGTALSIATVTIASRVVEGRRRAVDRLATATMYVCFALAVIPLVAVLGYTVRRGLPRFDGLFLSHSMHNVAEQDPGGGAYHAILGTVEQVGITTLIAVPLGLLTAVYIVEFAKGRVARALQLVVDVMIGIPSIVAGLFVLALWILALGQPFSGFAGSLALVILMLPTIIRTSEEMLRLVPGALREASLALGVARWRTIVSVVLPTALPGIVTGVLLGIARVMGETAPVLLTVFGNTSINANPFSGPQGSLPLFVFSEAGLPNDTALNRAWAGALTLILIVLLLNVAGRLFARWKAPSRGR